MKRGNKRKIIQEKKKAQIMKKQNKERVNGGNKIED